MGRFISRQDSKKGSGLSVRARFTQFTVQSSKFKCRNFYIWHLTFGILFSILIGLPVYSAQGKDPGTVRFLGFHAHKYQDFERGMVFCEVFGEMENIGTKELKGVRVGVEFLDEKGKVVHSEEMDMVPRVIVFGNPRGIERPLKNSEIGVFSLNTKECPSSWLEGRIRYKLIKAITGEE